MLQMFKTTLLMAGLTGLFMLVGYALGGQSGMLTALGFACLSNIAMYFFSDSLVLKMQGAMPLDGKYPQVERIVRELVTEVDMPMPKLYYVATDVPNAFATGRSEHHAVVAVTSGIMQILDDNELKAVLAHELGHVKHHDMLISTIAACLAGAISYIAQFAFLFGGSNRDGENNSNPFVTIVAVVLAPIAAMIIQMSISRSREYAADEYSDKVLHGGRYLEQALAKLEGWKQSVPPIQASPTQEATSGLMFANMFSMAGLSALFSTHPSTENRIKRLRELDGRR